MELANSFAALDLAGDDESLAAPSENSASNSGKKCV